MILNFPSANDPDGVWELKGGYDTAESYRTNPIITGSGTYRVSWNTQTVEIVEFIPPSNPQGRFAYYLWTEESGRQTLSSSGSQNFGVYYSTNGSGRTSTGQIPCDTYNYRYQISIDATFETNIPIFDTSAHKEAYVTASTDEEALTILQQYAINPVPVPTKCYVGCVNVPKDNSDLQCLIDYDSLTMESVSDAITTDIDWNEATFGNKKWKLEFMFSSYSGSGVSSGDRTILQLGSDRAIFYDENNKIQFWTQTQGYNPMEEESLTNSYKPFVFEYDGNGILTSYVDNVLSGIYHIDTDYESGSSAAKIIIGAYDNTKPFVGTFAYFRFWIDKSDVLDYLFEYNNLTIATESDCITTNVNYTTDRFEDNSWAFEFSLHDVPSNESCLLSTDQRLEWYIMASGQQFNTWYKGDRTMTGYAYLTVDDKIVFLYDAPHQTARLYVNGILKTTATSYDPEYSDDKDNKIRLGYYFYGHQYLYVGVINYIRMKLI